MEEKTMTTYKIIEDSKQEPSLEEAQKFVGGYVEGVELNNGDYMIINEEGKIHQLPVNTEATKVWEQSYGASDVIMGPAIVIKAKARKEWR
jgi:hypothetical protein|tara:strand:- start:727 stop:999 length:273 start_codon:yes stop_codon:yes gene_type:complete